MLFLTSSWKNFFIFIFSLFFFLNNASKSCAPFMEIFFPHDKLSMESFLSISSPSQPLPPTKKVLLKTPVHFPITITICKHRSKFVTCCPSHGDCGGVSRPQRHSYKVFRLRWIKRLSQNFDPLTLVKYLAWEGA